MAHALSLFQSSTTFVSSLTITIPSTGYFLERYAPVTAKRNDDGTYEDVTEPVDVMFYGSTITLLRTAINAVEAFLTNAADRVMAEAGVRYYFRFQPDGDSVVWRSEIVSGRVELAGDALTAYGSKQIRGRIIITRRHYWEGNTAEVQLASHLDGTPAVLGRRITNHKDTDDGNYLDIASTQITGVLPTPAWIRLKNTSGSSQGYRNWWITNNVFSSPVDFAWMFQGEGRISGGTPTSLGTTSDGQYLALTVNTTASVGWTLDGGQAQRAAGYEFRVLMRIAGAVANTLYITPAIWDSANNIRTTPFAKEITVSTTGTRLVDLGTLQIPPGLGNDTAQGGVILRLDIRSTTATTANIDYIQLFPTNSLRHLVQRGGTIAANDSLYDNPIEGLAYSEEDDGDDDKKHAIVTALESPVMLWPGKFQRMYLLHDIDSGDAPIATQTTVQVFYRPRLLTI